MQKSQFLEFFQWNLVWPRSRYITIKDHKEDFPNKISCCLTNHSKSSIGKISKVILDKISQQKQLITIVNYWKDNSSVIEWFNNFENKDQSSFMVFDIKSFYPSISKNLFIKVIQFAKQVTKITDEDINLIMQAAKNLITWWRHTMGKKRGKCGFWCFGGLLQWRRGMWISR